MEGASMRRFAGLLTLAVLAVPSSAIAAPPGGGLITEPFTCGGTETMVVHSAGLSAWVGDQHYAAASFSFTPNGGVTETRTFGKKLGLSGAISCSTVFPEGVFAVVAVPVPPQGG
jgi:hypothetical protein